MKFFLISNINIKKFELGKALILITKHWNAILRKILKCSTCQKYNFRNDGFYYKKKRKI